MARPIFRVRLLLVFVWLAAVVDCAQNDTSNGTSIYKLAVGTGHSSSQSESSSMSSPGFGSSKVEPSGSERSSPSSSSSTLVDGASNADRLALTFNGTTNEMFATEVASHGIPHSKPSGQPSRNAANSTESTSYITENVFVTVTTKIHANSTNTTATSTANATITSAPRSNFTTTLPAGIGTLGNVTFHTSCAYTDTACYSTCSANFDSCSYSWAQYAALSQQWMASLSSQDLLTYSLLSSTTWTWLYTETSFLATTIASATTYFHTPTTYTAITSAARPECQWVEQTFSSPYTVTMSTNNCTDGDYSTTFTTTVTETSTGPYAEYNGDFRYVTSTVGVYTTSTRTSVEGFYTTIVPSSFSITAPACQTAGCVGDVIQDCPAPAWSCTVGANCDLCTIYGGTVQLLYFPVTTSTSAPNGTVANTTSTPTITEAATMVYEGYTFSSPSVYISFETAYALNDCNSTIGQAHTGSIIGLDPSDLSSAIGNVHYQSYQPASGSVSAQYAMGAASFDLNNLNWPYNPFAYVNQPSCNTRSLIAVDAECQVITQGGYNPVLVVPSQIRNMDPAWASCALDWEGLYDPPSALQPATAEASVTLPNQKTSTTPASAAATPTTIATETQQATAPRTTTANMPAATDDDLTPSATQAADQDQTSADNSDPTAADPGGDDDQTRNDPSPAATADPTTTGVGDFIASVIGMVPSAQSGDSPQAGATSANQGTGNTGNSQSTGGSDSNTSGNDPSNSEDDDLPSNNQPSTQNNADWNDDAENNAVETQAASVATFSAGGSTHVANQVASNAVVIGGNTLSVGGSATELGGQTISIGSSGIVAASGGQTSVIQFPGSDATAASPGTPTFEADASPSEQQATFVAGETTYTAIQTAGADSAVLGGATIRQGGPAATLAGGETVSLGSDGLVVAGSSGTTTAVFQAPQEFANAAQQATFAIGGTTYTAAEKAGGQTAVVYGQTLSVNGPAVTIDGQTVSLGSNGIVFADGSGRTSTATFEATNTDVATFVVDGKTYTALQTDGSGTAVIDGKTLTAGGSAITIGDETVSLGSSGLVIIDNGKTSTASFQGLPASATPTNWISEAVVTIGSSIITTYGIAGKTDEVVIDGTTLTRGGSPITINGEVFSLGKDGLVEIDSTHTTTLTGVGVSASSTSSTSTSSGSSGMITSSPSSGSSTVASASNSSTTSAGYASRPQMPILVAMMICTFLTMFM